MRKLSDDDLSRSAVRVADNEHAFRLLLLDNTLAVEGIHAFDGLCVVVSKATVRDVGGYHHRLIERRKCKDRGVGVVRGGKGDGGKRAVLFYGNGEVEETVVVVAAQGIAVSCDVAEFCDSFIAWRIAYRLVADTVLP